MTKVAFIGSKQLGLSCLRRVHEIAPSCIAGVVTLDDRTDRRTVFGEFRSFAESSGLRLHVAKDRLDFEKLVCSIHVDICLVVGWYWLIGKETLDRMPQGFLGIHASLLPRLRGCAPLVWAMINGDREIGFSLFSLTERMDDGPIWGQRSVTVGEDDYISDVLEKVERGALHLLSDLWLSILEGRAKPVPQDDSQATFCSLRTPDDGQIDWSRPAKDICNFVRAQSEPYPGAFTTISGTRKLTIWRARPVNVRFYGTPGQVAEIRQDGVLVICGDSRPILVEEVGVDGNGKAPARDVLKSLRIRLVPAITPRGRSDTPG